jgi:hypothetical protein
MFPTDGTRLAPFYLCWFRPDVSRIKEVSGQTLRLSKLAVSNDLEDFDALTMKICRLLVISEPLPSLALANVKALFPAPESINDWSPDL